MAHHGHEPGDLSLSVSSRTVRIVAAILVPCAFLTAIALVLLWPGGYDAPSAAEGEERARGDVLQVDERACLPGPTEMPGGTQVCGTATIRITDGPGQDGTITVELPQGPGAPTVHTGDKVVLAYIPDAGEGVAQYAIIDHQRGQPLLLMLGLAALVIVAFGRWRGFRALVGLGISFAVLLLFVIPAILAGEPPLLVAIVGSSAIMFAVLYLTHGVNVHTSVAILGTLASLIITGLLAAAFTASTELTGFGNEETLYLSIMQQDVDMRGILLAGIIIGALGVLDDLTVTQATTVAELAQSPMSRLDLYRSATRVGRAHVASAVNTIVLAYAGASLPLLLLVAAGGQAIGEVVTSQFIAQEIVRSAVGTIGLVAAVPITTALAALVADPDNAVRGRHRD